ncbi:hypothetical protein CRUP_025739 [Coryphaenoides rupestris]|nr:hypothetical protein CRUP_025739 [Coryphaenoides rupestris]
MSEIVRKEGWGGAVVVVLVMVWNGKPMLKCWHLFPPEDTSSMYPTRFPYEESSVFSRVDVLRPDLGRFPAFRAARPHRVTLRPDHG